MKKLKKKKSSNAKELAASSEPRTLADLEKLAQKMLKEGRMPSPEVFDRIMEEARNRNSRKLITKHQCSAK